MVLVRFIIEATFAVSVRHWFIMPVSILLALLAMGLVAVLAGAAFIA